MATHPELPTWNTFAPYYDSAPVGHMATENVGSSTTAPMAPVDPPEATRTPRHILRDPQMCQILTQNARHYVNKLGRLPGDLLPSIHLATQMNLNVATGDEDWNIDVFTHAASYIRLFVEIADDLPAGSVQSIPLEERDGIQPNRKLSRQGIDRVIAEQKSVAVFDAHADQIQALGGINDNRGTPIVFGPTETGARSIVFRVGKHMIDANCSWALLLGGNEYMLFYLDRLVDQGDTYYHLVVSSRHAAFPPAAPQGTPCLIQVAIALLLGDVGHIAYSPPTSTVSITYAQGPRTTKPSRTSTTAPKSRKTAPSRMGTRSQTGGGGRRRPSTGLDLLGGVQFCSLAYPMSDLPDREFALSRVDAQKATAIMSGVVDDLPETAADSRSAHPLISRAEGSGQLLALEILGSGNFGDVYNSLCVINGHEEKRAIKVVQYQFHTFQAEISVYEQIGGKPFVPSFHGGFAGMWVTGPLGVLVMERIQRTFNTYDEMNEEEKRGALKCLEKLHAAGYHHGDVSARNFGARGSQMVVLDFSNAELCEASDPRACYELRTLKKNLFGEREA